jgi:DNA-binding NarL/FixJ family response regulator
MLSPLPLADRRATTLVIVDDHRMFREALKLLLEGQPALRVIGEGGHGGEAVRLARDLHPDILLLDLVMPVMSGLDALREVSRDAPDVRTVIVADTVGDNDVLEALQHGARGIVMKQSTPELLFKSIRTVMAGQYWVGRERVGEVIARMRDRNAPPASAPRRPTFGLTPREMEIVSAVVEGSSNQDIARQFSISPKTVKHHLTNIFEKVGVTNRLELALFAVRHRCHTGSVAAARQAGGLRPWS